MHILDTDHMTILERGGISAYTLRLRLRQVPAGETATTIVSYEEQMRGWLSRVSQAKTPEKLIAAYDFLLQNLEIYRAAQVLAYDKSAAEEFERLRQSQIRLATKDLRIAAICLANNATLLSRNLKHFQQVPDLKVEDWSA